MNKSVLVALLMLAASPASADSLLVEACKRTVAHLYMKKEIKVTRVDDFSNLKPPRVRMKEDGDGSLGDLVITCTFSSTTKPVGLREFCALAFCYKPGHRVFDEIAELMRRDGF